MNFIKNRERGQAGVSTFFQKHNFLENGSLKICATKKCLNLLCILFFFNKNVSKKMCNKKVHSDELCKKYGKRAGGRQHIFLDAQLFRKWFSKKLCNKKVLKSTLYFIFFIQGGRFQQKELGQHIFFVGGYCYNPLFPHKKTRNHHS